ncbi:MAG: hypothetical protein NPIRA02_05400 [Nitrospirales bacterium]|nr:MAG: hypothetical protein NPIRA02_05400 [Nitrospirales bacterium]
MNVVFDSNIFISATLTPGGKAEQAIQHIIEGRDHLLLSKDMIVEILDVLAQKFSRDQEELARVAVYLSELGELVKPVRRLKVLNDNPDNRILECAVEGHAGRIVTGDQVMLELGQYKGIQIVSLREYLENRES